MHACPWHSPPTRQLLRSLLESQAALSSRWPERVHEFISRASSKEWTSSSLDVTACHPSNWVDTVLSKLTPWEINMFFQRSVFRFHVKSSGVYRLANSLDAFVVHGASSSSAGGRTALITSPAGLACENRSENRSPLCLREEHWHQLGMMATPCSSAI